MRVLVLGAGGMLGREVLRALPSADGLSRQEFNISEPMDHAMLALGEFNTYDWIINCAAYTTVDRAESEPQLAHEANALGVRYLAESAAQLRAKVLHFSTDFVFDGRGSEPYRPSDATNPLGVYGQTKLEGERALAHQWVLRTSWLFSALGNCFPRTILRAHLAGKSVKVVGDQFGTPTYARDIARALPAILENPPPPGIHHISGPEVCSWHGFAERFVSDYQGVETKLEKITTEDWPTPAVRPRYSALHSSFPLPPLAESIAEFNRELKELGGP